MAGLKEKPFHQSNSKQVRSISRGGFLPDGRRGFDPGLVDVPKKNNGRTMDLLGLNLKRLSTSPKTATESQKLLRGSSSCHAGGPQLTPRGGGTSDVERAMGPPQHSRTEVHRLAGTRSGGSGLRTTGERPGT